MLVITGESHLDHGVSDTLKTFILEKYEGKNEFFIDTFVVPEGLGTLECALYGPEMGDLPVPEREVRYAVRGTRTCASRLCERPTRQTRTMTVIGGPDDHGNPCVLYTTYGGPNAPREPGDPAIQSWEDILAARLFWTTHALAK